MTWRTGRKVGRTIYNGDTLIGIMDTPELAQQVVTAVNAIVAAVKAGPTGQSSLDACGRGICAKNDGHKGPCNF